MKKTIFATVVLLLVAAAGAGTWYALRPDGEAVRYRLAKVERGPIEVAVAATGTVNAVSTVQVSTPIPGQVKEIYADFNTPVKKGQVLARLDATGYELRVNQARADVDAAQGAVAALRSSLQAEKADLGRANAAVAAAERDFERRRPLAEKGFISPAELARARAALEAARENRAALQAQIKANETQLAQGGAVLKQREAALRQTQVALERTFIRAPEDGTVILRNVDTGQTVATGPQAGALFTIAHDLREMRLEAALDAADAARLRAGMNASFSVDAFPRHTFSGEVRAIRESPQKGEGSAAYALVIAVPNPDLALLPGMSAKVRIVLESRADALKVPNAALTWRRTSEPGPHIWVLANGAPKAVRVRPGINDGVNTELVQSPLPAGTEVIVGTATTPGS
ncbi:MAG TPA: efflux RND transporter periplasmic adaptor subunit [Burkholderiales bacterium]|nr:efflux RND transporter periplasmic adaptor subunit [Burkholderiales bacterium]